MAALWQAAGPRRQWWSARSEARTTDLDAGVTAATSRPLAPGRWPCSGARRTRQPVVDRHSATLMYAG